MTEERGKYDVMPKPGVIRASCFLPYADEGYTAPTPAEIRTMIHRLDMSGAAVANFVGVSSSRTVRKWQAEDALNQASIPYAAWRLLVERYHRVREGGPTEICMKNMRVVDDA